MLSCFCKPFRTLSLSRILVQFSLKLVYYNLCGKIFKFMVFKFLENALNLDIFTYALLLPVKIPTKVLITTFWAQENYSFPLAAFLRNICLPQQLKENGINYYLLYQNPIRKYKDDLENYFLWFVIFQMWWLHSFVSNIYHIVWYWFYCQSFAMMIVWYWIYIKKVATLMNGSFL